MDGSGGSFFGHVADDRLRPVSSFALSTPAEGIVPEQGWKKRRRATDGPRIAGAKPRFRQAVSA
jgi:hypothetical protein